MALNWIFLIALSLIWGASFMGVTLALEGFGPLSVMLTSTKRTSPGG